MWKSDRFEKLDSFCGEVTDLKTWTVLWRNDRFHAVAGEASGEQHGDTKPDLLLSTDTADSPRLQRDTLSSGSNSSQNGDAVTLRQKSRSKKNFIKNIKPEAFKRPSSYSCSEVEKLEIQKTVGKLKSKDEKGVTLIGYSKVPKPNLDPSRAVLLGTLSPTRSEPGEKERPQSTAYPLRPAASMSSVLARTCWSRGSSASLPEFSGLSQGQEGGAAGGFPTGSQATPEVTEVEANGSLAGALGEKRAVFQARRSFTTPMAECPTGGELVSAANANGSGPCFHNCQASEGERKSDLPLEGQVTADAEGGVEDALSLSGVDCNVNQASREISTGVEIDDDTHVENGYDEASEGGVQSASVANVDSGVKLSSDVTSSTCDNISLSSQSAHTMSRESGIVSDVPAASQDISQDELARDTSSATLTDADDFKAPSSERKVTVIELLREEYERLQLEKSASGPPSVQASPVHCHRASSDTDIIRNLEHSTMAGQRASENLFTRPKTALGVHRERSRLSTSSSYPELSRWVEQSEQVPKLVSVVGHSTVK